MLTEVFELVIEATVGACRQFYADRLEGVVIYGSAALGTVRHDSDIDILVVADPLPHGRIPRMREFDGVQRLLAGTLKDAWDRGVPTRLSPVITTLGELDLSGFLLFDIACDGVVRYDRGARVTAYLAGVRERLEKRGAERRVLNGARYWMLDPNVKPGDIITL